MLKTAVTLIAFNRPELTRRTLDAVRRVQPQTLFLIADGPRSTHPSDDQRCAATRQVLGEIDWPCTVHRRFADTNLGLEANVELGLDWMFARTQRSVVLEDDCVPDPTFFRFAEELLERYRDDPRVWYVAGNNLGLGPRPFGNHDYAFSAWASVWGWAGWADRWARHRQIFTRDHDRRPDGSADDRPVRTKPVPAAIPTLVTRAGRRHFAGAAASGDTVTHGWDKHLWLTMMTEGGLAVTPARSMVQNEGVGDADATHTSGAGGDGQVYGVSRAMQFPLRHPPAVALDVAVERELELVLARVGSRTAQTARRLVRWPWLRRAIRKVVSSRAAMSGARLAARLAQGRSAR